MTDQNPLQPRRERGQADNERQQVIYQVGMQFRPTGGMREAERIADHLLFLRWGFKNGRVQP